METTLARTRRRSRLKATAMSCRLDYAVNRWRVLDAAMNPWRNKLARYERMADDDYSDRRASPDERHTDALASLFARQNHTLGVISGFADFTYAQGRNDIFGTRPWLAATPEGPSSDGLADKITKNSQWKLNQSNIESVLLDSLRISCDLGTAFVGLRWIKEVETSQAEEHVAVSLSTGEPILSEVGDYITDLGGLPPDMDPADLDWQERLIETSDTVRNNIDASLLDYRNIAFETTAPEMALHHTDVFHRFRMGAYDAAAIYGLSDEQRDQLVAMAMNENNQEPRGHRDETDTRITDTYRSYAETNPVVWMVEGFMRMDPTKTGNLVRVHCVFSPMLHAMLSMDYLANITPKGLLPVFPIRCFKTAGRIIGRGYFERCEDAGTAIDGQYNAITLRNRTGAEVVKGFHRSALADQNEGDDFVLAPDYLHELAEDKTLKDLIEFMVMPDTNNRADVLMNEIIQTTQMRFGITSVSQGELKGVPSASTATGVRDLQTRGAMLVKWPIDQQSDDIQPLVQLAVTLIYANQDEDETFTWGEGKDAELIELKADAVKGLKMKVTLSMTQAQNQQKLQAAQTAIGIVSTYAQLPEAEKTAPRGVFVQALSSLGFDNADELIRQATMDPQGIMALLPPDMQKVFQEFLQSQGMGGDPNATAAVPGAMTDPNAPAGVQPEAAAATPVGSSQVPVAPVTNAQAS